MPARRRGGRVESQIRRGGPGCTIQGEGGQRGRGLGLPPEEASVLTPSLGNRTQCCIWEGPATVSPACPLCSSSVMGLTTGLES